MKCPFCGNTDTQVVDSRWQDEGNVIRRRRRCPDCEKRFTTFERVEKVMPVVVKRDGRRTEFDLSKVEASMSMALRKRPVSTEARDRALIDIQDALFNLGEKEVSTDAVGELVMETLKELDQVAYVRFASVYQSFEHIDEFVKAIGEMQKKGITTKK
ncbi:MAG: transcriptional repressor NrdR [Alcaligenaceae bacterium]|nr:transcriptional repressor NrdR [Alcaligenaceae bacterium]